MIEGSSGSYLPVHLPHDIFVRPSNEAGEGITTSNIDGHGPFFGLYLRREGDRHLLANVLAARAVERVGCPSACSRRSSPVWVQPSNFDDEACLDQAARAAILAAKCIPAGDYRLYLIADGAPVRAVISIDGDAGSVTVAPRQPTTVRTVELAPQPGIVGDTGEHYELVGPASLPAGPSERLFVLEFGLSSPRYQSSPAYRFELCTFKGEQPPQAFGSGCFDRSNAGAAAVEEEPRSGVAPEPSGFSFRRRVVSYHSQIRDLWSTGGNITVKGPFEAVTSVAAMIGLSTTGAELPAPSTPPPPPRPKCELPRLISRTVVATRRAARVRLRCGRPGSCSAAVTLAGRGRLIRLRPAQRAVVRIPLAIRLRRKLQYRRSVNAVLRIQGDNEQRKYRVSVRRAR